MSKARTIKFLFENDQLFAGDSFKIAGKPFEHFISYIDDEKKIVETEGGETFNFSAKIYTTGKIFDGPKNVKQTKSGKTYTFSFKATVDFEYVDDESESFEEALSKFRATLPWPLILKSKVVDWHTDPELFALIENYA